MIDSKLTVWTHSQGVYPLRASMAHVLGMSEDEIRVLHMEGPGCYGHNGADDAALDAALLARALPGRPVSLKWTRADEHAWADGYVWASGYAWSASSGGWVPQE